MPTEVSYITLMFTYKRQTSRSDEDTLQLINICGWHREWMCQMKGDDVYVRKCCAKQGDQVCQWRKLFVCIFVNFILWFSCSTGYIPSIFRNVFSARRSGYKTMHERLMQKPCSNSSVNLWCGNHDRLWYLILWNLSLIWCDCSDGLWS
jgi:hypothetical protein